MSAETCDHCGRDFDEEAAYLRHLRDEHGDDLGPIEVRRVAAIDTDEGGRSVATYAGAVGALAVVGALVYLLAFAGGNGGGGEASAATTPTGVGTAHYHGPITVEIGGDELDFGQRQFQLQADAFHFENGNGERWHGHAQDVTLAWAMDTLGIEVTEDSVTYDGTTYEDGENATVVVEVNGESVDPETYVLQDGDSIRIVAEQS